MRVYIYRYIYVHKLLFSNLYGSTILLNWTPLETFYVGGKQSIRLIKNYFGIDINVFSGALAMFYVLIYLYIHITYIIRYFL